MSALESLTSGFNSYFNQMFSPRMPWRMHNSLDIAPLCWWSLPGIRNIYQRHGLDWGPVERDFIEDLFDKAEGKGYAQPSGEWLLHGSFDDSIIDDDLWIAQALHQHHATTYQILVDAAFPEQQAV